MLGRLQMDVDDGISAYCRLLRAIHGPARSQLPPAADGCAAKLHASVAKEIAPYVGSEAEAFDVATDHGCRVFVRSLPYVEEFNANECLFFFRSVLCLGANRDTGHCAYSQLQRSRPTRRFYDNR